MYKRIATLSIIVAVTACSAESQPKAVAANAGGASVRIDVASVTAPQQQSPTVTLPHVAKVTAVPASEARVQLTKQIAATQPGSVSLDVTKPRVGYPTTPKTVNAVARADASVAGDAADQPLDLSLYYQPGADGWSSDDWFDDAPTHTSASGFDASTLFDNQAEEQDVEVSFSIVPAFKENQEFAWTRFPELDGGSVSFEVRTR